jgi:hypothetical protein
MCPVLTSLHTIYAMSGTTKLAQDDHFKKLLCDVLIKLLCRLAAQNEYEAEDEFRFHGSLQRGELFLLGKFLQIKNIILRRVIKFAINLFDSKF